MLEQILDELRNDFADMTVRGPFAVEDGVLKTTDFLLEGQYYRIRGSRLNDGVYRHPAEGLTDERFEGTVTAMRIPRAVLELAEDVKRWQEKYGQAAASPYLSEKLGDYSYSKGNTLTRSEQITWQSAFADRLRPWRKL